MGGTPHFMLIGYAWNAGDKYYTDVDRTTSSLVPTMY